MVISPILRKCCLGKKTYTSKYIQTYNTGIHMNKNSWNVHLDIQCVYVLRQCSTVHIIKSTQGKCRRKETYSTHIYCEMLYALEQRKVMWSNQVIYPRSWRYIHSCNNGRLIAKCEYTPKSECSVMSDYHHLYMCSATPSGLYQHDLNATTTRVSFLGNNRELSFRNSFTFQNKNWSLVNNKIKQSIFWP